MRQTMPSLNCLCVVFRCDKSSSTGNTDTDSLNTVLAQTMQTINNSLGRFKLLFYRTLLKTKQSGVPILKVSMIFIIYLRYFII